MKFTLRDLARRWKTLDAEAKQLSGQIKALVEHAAPELVELFGVSSELAGQFLVTVGDNTNRIRNEAAFAKLCGVSPKPASSGRTSGRHRLNRGGDRAANSALYIITIVRLRHHQPTRDYVARRTAEGLTQTRDHPMPQALHRSRSLQEPRQPTAEQRRRESELSTSRLTNIGASSGSIQTMLREGAYGRAFTTSQQRRQALRRWLTGARQLSTTTQRPRPQHPNLTTGNRRLNNAAGIYS